MAPMKVVDRKREIYQLLEDDQIKTIVLYGEPGVGKTWIAREASSNAKKGRLFDTVLWLYLNREYDFNTLRDCIAQGLSLLPTHRECEVEEGNGELKREEEVEPGILLKKIVSAFSKQKVLLVLDDEGNKMEEQKIRDLLNSILKLSQLAYKVLITTRNNPKPTTDMGDGRKNLNIKPMLREESLSLLKERACLDCELEDIDNLAKDFVEKTKDMPNAIVLMAKAFKYFSEKGGAVPLKRSLGEPSDNEIFNLTDLLCSGYDLVPNSVLIDCQRDDKDQPFFIDSRCINHNALIAYWMMEGYLSPVTLMEKAYRKGHQIFMELIDFQVLKRVEPDYVTLNPLNDKLDDFLFRRAINDYRRGYYANVRLGLDSIYGDNDWKALVRITHRGGVMKTLHGGRQGEQTVSALLLDGNSLANGLPGKSIKSLRELQVLAIFNPTVGMLSHFSDEIISKLHVFVLRSCLQMESLSQITSITKFENLTVLEISGSSSLDEIPDDFFKGLSKLQSLNLSSIPIVSLPASFYELGELRWVILRDCPKLGTLRSLRKCKSLMVLDCSDSTSLQDIQDRSFMNEQLRMINLSNTRIKILPLIGSLRNLTHLLLSGCRFLNRLRSISSATSLEVIDLSNATEFNEFYDKSLKGLVNLKVLDISGTMVSNVLVDVGNPRHLCLENCSKLQGSESLACLKQITVLELFVLSRAAIKSLPPLSHLTNLRQLLVTYCSQLKEVPNLSSLEKLEILDFSGCNGLSSIPNGTFDKMSRLQSLDLSATCIQCLPSLSGLLNLRRLFLTNCIELKELPSIEPQSLSKLEELSISCGKALEKIPSNFFAGMGNLQKLDLSETSLDELPSVSNLTNLRELYLRGCKGLKSIPDLEVLTKLEILDLSESAVSNLPSRNNLRSLRQLMLRDCSNLDQFWQKEMHNILGASVGELPNGILDWSSLERLDLPGIGIIQGSNSKGTELEGTCSKETKPEGADSEGVKFKRVDTKETNPIEKGSDGFDWGISSFLAKVAVKEKRPYVSISGTQFIRGLEKDPSLWNSSLKKFHLSVHPIKELDGKSVLHFHGEDFVFRDIYIWNRHFGESEEQRLLEIYGFKDYPKGIDKVLRHASQLLFIDNNFQTWPSFLTTFNPDRIKGCWIEKAGKLESIFPEDMNEISDLLNSIEVLWVSNAESLKSIYGGIPKYMIFQNLERLYLDCCQNLSTVLSLPQLPGNLRILQIKFCDGLRKVFETTSPDTNLQTLEILHLWELPELESIGCGLPSLKTLKISNCPKLQNLEETIKSIESLQTLRVSNVCDLKMIGGNIKQLKHLSLDSCPNLLTIFSSSQLPSNLETLCVRCCNGLETIFENGGTSLEIKLQKLEKLHLQGLPKLRSIGTALPNQIVPVIVDCLNCKD